MNIDPTQFLSRHTPLAEETAVWPWQDRQMPIRIQKVLGFLHFHHLSPKPEGFPHRHPDFFQPVYTAQADHFIPEAQITDDIEAEAVFHPITEARALITDANLLQLLALALTTEAS